MDGCATAGRVDSSNSIVDSGDATSVAVENIDCESYSLYLAERKKPNSVFRSDYLEAGGQTGQCSKVNVTVCDVPLLAQTSRFSLTCLIICTVAATRSILGS